MGLEIGQVVDKYIVERKLGEGATATVYRVRHGTLGSTHALKVLDASGNQLRERLMMEGKVQAKLRHPNVVSVTDVISVGGSPGLVMEYVRGPSLAAWLQQTTPDLQQALLMFAGIVAGVRAAHDIGVIHRDLKPQNVLLDETTPVLRPRVADFGLVKHLGESSASSTQTGATMGTPEYMAPEQIRDSASVDHRADMWSLGCILYRLVCGHGPFDGPDPLTVFNKVAASNYPAPSSRRPDLPDSIEAVIDQLLRLRVSERIQSCDELLEALGLDVETTADASGWHWNPDAAPEAPAEGEIERRITFGESRDRTWITQREVTEDRSGTPLMAFPREQSPERGVLTLALLGGGALVVGIVVGALWLGGA